MDYSIPLITRLGMALRRVPAGKIRTELKKAERHSLDLDHSILECHFLAGGDIQDLTNALVYAKENGMKLSTWTACAGQIMAQFQEKIKFTEKLKLMHQEGVRDLDDFLP